MEGERWGLAGISKNRLSRTRFPCRKVFVDPEIDAPLTGKQTDGRREMGAGGYFEEQAQPCKIPVQQSIC
jgi:hypothetical protein